MLQAFILFLVLLGIAIMTSTIFWGIYYLVSAILWWIWRI